MQLRRHNHLFKDAIKYWKLDINTSDILEFSVVDEENTAGFIFFNVTKENDKTSFTLMIKSQDLDSFHSQIGNLLTEHYNILTSTKLFASMKVKNVLIGFTISTEEPRMMQVLLNAVDTKLQFERAHYDLINNRIPMIEPSNSCKLL